MLNQTEQPFELKTISIHGLYEQYAGMLLGYISAIVKDKELAENYLVSIFSKVAQEFNDINWGENGTWHLLRNFAKRELVSFTTTVQSCEYDVTPSAGDHTSNNKYLIRMTDEQKHIFCGVYYHKQTIAQLSKVIGMPEGLVQKNLKEALAVIKVSHGR